MAEKQEKRSLVERIFGTRKKKKDVTYEICRLLNSWQTTFTPFSGDAYSQAQVRTAVNAFAKRAALVKPRHVQYNPSWKSTKKLKTPRCIGFYA